ncbi:MAG: hypothetical protein KGO22_03210, partial [Gammaproteobacteria bacterium]|nr:hypothetical protein [Gammaproteobacteria bacterium]
LVAIETVRFRRTLVMGNRHHDGISPCLGLLYGTSRDRRLKYVAMRSWRRRASRGSAAPAHRPQPSSEELFGREPFTSGREPRYYGTGVPFYQSGPGFTGGYYGYGDERPEILLMR